VSPGEEAVFFASKVCGDFKRRNDLSPGEGFRKNLLASLNLLE
jgi:hypothetical protein